MGSGLLGNAFAGSLERTFLIPAPPNDVQSCATEPESFHQIRRLTYVCSKVTSSSLEASQLVSSKLHRLVWVPDTSWSSRSD